MSIDSFVSAHKIRLLFTLAMSKMYQEEVPQYAKLCSLVTAVNNQVLEKNLHLLSGQEKSSLSIERHGAIRLGTAEELSTMRRLFAVMAMLPVDYYDLSVAGIPVHSTAFRSIDVESLETSPFRVFTSLLRLDLIDDSDLRKQAEQILSKRHIFSEALLNLIETSEQQGGLNKSQTDDFVLEALKVFCWHQNATVDKETYDDLNQAHRLIADVVSFKAPHINHLTPRTLDIDEVQVQLTAQGFKAKAIVEGPPARLIPILLRQTSFIALEEAIIFSGNDSNREAGTHTARFGEIEQRGIALTPKGRDLYDRLLQQARSADGEYERNLKIAFEEFPDSHEELRDQALAYYQYSVGNDKLDLAASSNVNDLIDNGSLAVTPIVYEDFLPVSAAGIFQSNLSNQASQEAGHSPNQDKFETDLGASVIDSFSLYEQMQKVSLDKALKKLEMENQ